MRIAKRNRRSFACVRFIRLDFHAQPLYRSSRNASRYRLYTSSSSVWENSLTERHDCAAQPGFEEEEAHYVASSLSTARCALLRAEFVAWRRYRQRCARRSRGYVGTDQCRERRRDSAAGGDQGRQSGVLPTE